MARKPKSAGSRRKPDPGARAGVAADLRIIGGRYRGSRLRYHGEEQVRPMKHRVREAIFDLISVESEGRQAIDLFAGTGALGLEALSRGAIGATFIEQHVPTARIVQENIDAVGARSESTLLTTSAFLWVKRDLPQLAESLATSPWLVFCCPPYAFYVDRQAQMLDLVARLLAAVPPRSILVVEADARFDFELLPGGDAPDAPAWDLRSYPPAYVGLLRTP